MERFSFSFSLFGILCGFYEKGINGLDRDIGPYLEESGLTWRKKKKKTYLEEAEIFVFDGLQHPLLAQIADPCAILMKLLKELLKDQTDLGGYSSHQTLPKTQWTKKFTFLINCKFDHQAAPH